MSSSNNLSYQRTARSLTVACGLLFSCFSFVYTYLFQPDVIEALHFSLSHGKTHYSPLAGAIIITIILLIFRWGINGLMGLKGPVRTLSYFPSCLCLGVLTDIGRSVYTEAGLPKEWLWMLPLSLLGYTGIVYGLRRVFRVQLNERVSTGCLVNSNLFILLFLCLMTVCIGNTEENFHHELALEKAIRQGDYAAVHRIGYKSLNPSRTLTVLRAYALAREGKMGENLFDYPQLYGDGGLLFDANSAETLRMNADSLYLYLGARPFTNERPTDFFARICRDESGRHVALDYYMSALLLDKRLDQFIEALSANYFEEDTLPRYYREAIVLYQQTHTDCTWNMQDSLTEQHWQEYVQRQHGFTTPAEEKNRMHHEYGDTYWWYYQYQ